MNKKVGKMTLSMALAAALAFAPAQAFAAPATDISGHWAEKVITQWQEKGLISGYEDGTFKPDNSVTRAEFVIILNKALGFTQKGNVTFSDVSANAWYYDAWLLQWKQDIVPVMKMEHSNPMQPLPEQKRLL